MFVQKSFKISVTAISLSKILQEYLGLSYDILSAFQN